MYTVEALDRLILFRQKPDSLLRRLMATEEAVRVAAQGELFPSYGSGVPADRTR